MRYAIVKADGSHEIVEIEGRWDYRKIQELVAAPGEVGAMFQAVGGRNVTILMNENGKYLPLAVNRAVTQYARDNALIWPHDDVRGDCIVVGEPDDQGYEKDVDDGVLNAILAYK